jgi:hypothetical protein
MPLSDRIILHNELDKTSNKAAMDYSEILSLHLSGETEETPQKSSDWLSVLQTKIWYLEFHC